MTQMTRMTQMRGATEFLKQPIRGSSCFFVLLFNGVLPSFYKYKRNIVTCIFSSKSTLKKTGINSLKTIFFK